MTQAELPLAGVRVLVTRPTDQASRLSDALRAEGADVIEQPTIAFEPPLDWAPVDTAVNEGGYTWIVFTSATGVRFFTDRLREQEQSPDWMRQAKVAAIGPETARSLAELGIMPDLVPDEFVAEALAAAMADEAPLSGTRILVPTADAARDTLPAALAAEGARVERVTCYRTVVPKPTESVLAELRAGRIDVATFTSASTVTNLAAMLGADRSVLGTMILACIGPITARELQAQGFRASVIATKYTIPGLVEALREYYLARRTAPGRLGQDAASGPRRRA